MGQVVRHGLRFPRSRVPIPLSDLDQKIPLKSAWISETRTLAGQFGSLVLSLMSHVYYSQFFIQQRNAKASNHEAILPFYQPNANRRQSYINNYMILATKDCQRFLWAVKLSFGELKYHLKFVLKELLVMVCTFLLYESFTKTVLGLLFKYKYLMCG